MVAGHEGRGEWPGVQEVQSCVIPAVAVPHAAEVSGNQDDIFFCQSLLLIKTLRPKTAKVSVGISCDVKFHSICLPFLIISQFFLQFRPWIPKADSDGLSVHHCDPFHRHAYLFIAVLLVDLQFCHPLPQFRHPGFLGCIVGLALLRCRDLFLEGLFFVHHCLELGIEDLIIHVFQHLIQQQCLLGGDVLQFLTQIDETDSTNGMEQNLIPNNPAAEVDPPKFDGAPMKILTEAQLDAFMRVIEKDAFWHDFFYTAVTTGLRRGEICALRWEDFDTKQETLHVRRTLHKEKGKPLTTGDTKTYAGTRKIILPPSTAEILRKRQSQICSPWIFYDPFRPELPINPSRAYQQLKTLLTEAGLPDIRFHDLRHTFATHALSSGVDAKTLAGILGHTKASFTLDTYTHTTGDMQKRAAEIVGGFLTDYLGEEMNPWQSRENMAAAPSV